ncbi:MAG: glutamate 5-kinase [Gammaproteobacteria bacterium]|nr:glutamate 5-kinase [Gammaproteobacteria bacterium]
MRRRLVDAKRWVIKIGSTLLTNEGQGLDLALIHSLTRQIAALKEQGAEVVLVSSGSIAEGMARLNWTTKPTAVHRLQAAAAVGQMGLIQAYESGFKKYNLGTAQILLTHEDLANRRRYLNARSTLRTLLKLQIVPVVNENDTVTTAEIRFGDNDTLAAMVANLVEADVLVLLTDQLGLYDRDPRQHANATLLERADAADPAIKALAGPSGSSIGSGGMLTKVQAAERAAQAGTTTIIASGHENDVLCRLKSGEELGTMLTSQQQVKLARKQWLANQLRVGGMLFLDPGACDQIQSKGSSLLAVGVTHVDGEFQRGELVACVTGDGREVARGLVNYSSEQASQLCGISSEKIEDILGYSLEPELIHRDNMVVTAAS